VERRKERPKRDHANRRAVRSEDSGQGSNQGEHTLYLIVEVDDESQVLAFLAPFESGKQRGHLPSLDVRRGSRQRQLRGADAGSVNLCQLWIPHGRHANVRFYLRNHFHISRPLLNSFLKPTLSTSFKLRLATGLVGRGDSHVRPEEPAPRIYPRLGSRREAESPTGHSA
jgi:hypothetical protein